MIANFPGALEFSGLWKEKKTGRMEIRERAGKRQKGELEGGAWGGGAGTAHPDASTNMTAKVKAFTRGFSKIKKIIL